MIERASSAENHAEKRIAVHPVMRLIKERLTEESKPGQRRDGFKLGAVVEGGAMRGIVSAAQLLVFRRLGLLTAFDCFYGESIGGSNAAWALSGNLEGAIRLYFEDVNNRNFIDMRRLFSLKPVIDINFLKQVAMRKYPIDLSVLKDSGVEMNLLATRVDKSSPNNSDFIVSINDFKDLTDFLEVTQGTLTVPPPLGSPPIKFRGEVPLWDVGIVDLLPVQEAIKDGCTHILVFSCVPEGYQANQYPLLGRLLISLGILKYNRFLIDHFNLSRPRYNQTLKMLSEKQLEQDGPPYIAMLSMPSGVKVVHSFEMNPRVLKLTAQIAEQAAYQALCEAGIIS